MKKVVDFTSQSKSMATTELQKAVEDEAVKEIEVHHHPQDKLDTKGFTLVDRDVVDDIVFSRFRRGA